MPRGAAGDHRDALAQIELVHAQSGGIITTIAEIPRQVDPDSGFGDSGSDCDWGWVKADPDPNSDPHSIWPLLE